MVVGELLINGAFLGGECDQTFSRQIVKSPYDGHVVGAAAEGGESELLAAIDAASSAFIKWRESTRSTRINLLSRIAQEVRVRRQEFADLLVEEIGKPITMALAEVDRLAVTFDDAAHTTATYGLESLPVDLDPRGERHICTVERFPLGAIFAMAPYNWPFNLVAHKIAPALATGNTLVIKTSPLAPLSTMRLVRMLHEVGCPDGVVNVWNGADKHVEAALRDPRIKLLSFTGSGRVGWMLKNRHPELPAILELGGDAFAIVEEDADLDWAIGRLISGSFGFAGQICISIQHILVHHSRYEETRERLVKATQECPTGDPRDQRTVNGPLINEAAAQQVKRLIDEAVTAGAIVLAGGERNGNFVAPTLIENVPDRVALMKEEAFGPVVTLSSYHDLTEAIEKVNRSQFGIQAGLFTFDIRKIQHAFRNIETGGLIVNDYPTLRFDNVPYGGVRQSGVGREGVKYAMDEMTVPRALVQRPF